MSWDSRSMGPGQPPSPFQSPLPFDPYASRPKSSSTPWLLALIGGGGLILVLLCCGGTAGLFMAGMGLMGAEMKELLRDNETLREHVGEVESVEVDLFATGAMEEEDTFRYRVKGSKGSGELTVKQHTGFDGNEIIDEATLRLPDGTKVQIVP